jgi:hypothetical protein
MGKEAKPTDGELKVKLRLDRTAPPGDLVGALAALLLRRARAAVAARRAEAPAEEGGPAG